jgi:quinoprotein glucose dehydrogenase
MVAFALPTADENAPPAAAAGSDGWLPLFDGRSLDGWVHLNGSHTFSVEDGAIVGRTSPGSRNSFLCTTREFDDFELELETTVDHVTNQGIQIRSQVRPSTVRDDYNFSAGRVYGPQVEIRRYYEGQPTTGTLYGEALGTSWLTSKEKIAAGHRHFVADGWNHLRIVAAGPRIRTWVNGQLVEDLVNERVHRTHPRGFIALQIHGITGNEPEARRLGLRAEEPLVMKWRQLRIRPLPSAPPPP